jgi:hypothetical protein
VEQGKEQRRVTVDYKAGRRAGAVFGQWSKNRWGHRRRAEQVSPLLLLSLSNRRNGGDGRGYRNKKRADVERRFIGLVYRPTKGRPDRQIPCT